MLFYDGLLMVDSKFKQGSYEDHLLNILCRISQRCVSNGYQTLISPAYTSRIHAARNDGEGGGPERGSSQKPKVLTIAAPFKPQKTSRR
jgi:hypothetical protein